MQNIDIRMQKFNNNVYLCVRIWKDYVIFAKTFEINESSGKSMEIH